MEPQIILPKCLLPPLNMINLFYRYAVTSRLTEKVDVYSFGVVIFEAMCGQLPILRDAKTGNMEIQISDWVGN